MNEKLDKFSGWTELLDSNGFVTRFVTVCFRVVIEHARGTRRDRGGGYGGGYGGYGGGRSFRREPSWLSK